MQLKKKLIVEIATIASALHTNGINHRDFYACHFLLDISTGLDYIITHRNQIKLRLYLIDLHRAQLRETTPVRWIIKDLASLYFSCLDFNLNQRDILRFIGAYTQQPLRINIAQHQRFWQKVKKRAYKLYRSTHR